MERILTQQNDAGLIVGARNTFLTQKCGNYTKWYGHRTVNINSMWVLVIDIKLV